MRGVEGGTVDCLYYKQQNNDGRFVEFNEQRAQTLLLGGSLDWVQAIQRKEPRHLLFAARGVLASSKEVSECTASYFNG